MEKYLYGGEIYLSKNASETYTVKDGNVLVYIAPVANNMPGRRLFICEAVCGDVIPSFNYTDFDDQKWVFCLVALERAEIQINPNSINSDIQDNFAQKIKLRSYKNEGYNDGLVEY